MQISSFRVYIASCTSGNVCTGVEGVQLLISWVYVWFVVDGPIKPLRSGCAGNHRATLTLAECYYIRILPSTLRDIPRR